MMDTETGSHLTKSHKKSPHKRDSLAVFRQKSSVLAIKDSSYSFHRGNYLHLERLVTPMFAGTRGHSPKWYKSVAIPSLSCVNFLERCLSRYVFMIRSPLTYDATTCVSIRIRNPTISCGDSRKTTTANVAIAKSNEILRR